MRIRTETELLEQRKRERLIKRALVIFVAGAALSVAALILQPIIPFFSKAGNFSIVCPQRLRELIVQYVDNKNYGLLEVHQFAAGVSKKTVYGVSYFDLPPEQLSKSGQADTIRSFRDGMLAGLNGVLASDRSIYLRDFPGLESMATFAFENTEYSAKARTYLVGNRVYQLLAATAKDTKGTAISDRFLDSFKLQD